MSYKHTVRVSVAGTQHTINVQALSGAEAKRKAIDFATRVYGGDTVTVLEVKS